MVMTPTTTYGIIEEHYHTLNMDYTYKGSLYIYVNQKTIDGIEYTAYRGDENPRKSIIVSDNKVKVTKQLKVDWEHPNTLF
jgi:hypothetical protein